MTPSPPFPVSDLQRRLAEALGSAYVLERELGGGGMSRVFIATETALGRAVVIKVLPPELEGAVSAERFRREISLAAKLQHPAIVPLLTAGEAGGLLFYTMPYIEGTTLRAELERSGALSIERATRILRDVLEALSYAHARGVIHRDIKPENVLLTAQHAVVSDFGVAKALDAAGTEATGGGVTSTGIVLGSPGYMSPEQAAADATLDQRSDLYSTGVLAYEMLAGSAPFAGRPAPQVLAAHLTEKPAPIGAKRSGVPAPLASLVARLLAKSPSDRPVNADAALDELEGRTAGARRSALGTAMRTAAAGAGLAVFVGVLAFAIAKMRARPVTAERRAPSIAVLRFDDLSAGKANAYLSDGISEELIGALSRVSGLRVVGRASSFRFKSDSLTPAEIGQRLDVSTLLTGSVQSTRDSLRVIASLTDASSGTLLWSETYDRKLASVFAIEDELSRAIVAKLSTTLTAGAASARTGNVEAYQLYLQGRYFWNKRDEASLRKSIEFFDRAIAIDSDYARAYAGLADAWNVIGGFMFEPPLVALAKAKTAAQKAVALDPDLAEAHATLGFVHMFYDWDWEGARRELERAVALDPNYTVGLLYYAYYLDVMGRSERSLEQFHRALALDPMSLILNLRYGDELQSSRRYDEAIAQYRHTIDLDSTFVAIGPVIPQTYMMKGDYATALKEFARFDRPGKPYVGGDRIYALARSGLRDSARTMLAELRRQADLHRPGSARDQGTYMLMLAYVGLGERDSAIAGVRRTMDARGAHIVDLASSPLLDELRDDPRFIAEMRRANLPARSH